MHTKKNPNTNNIIIDPTVENIHKYELGITITKYLLKPRYTCPNVPLPSSCPFFQREPGLVRFSAMLGLRGAEGVVVAEYVGENGQ